MMTLSSYSIPDSIFTDPQCKAGCLKSGPLLKICPYVISGFICLQARTCVLDLVPGVPELFPQHSGVATAQWCSHSRSCGHALVPYQLAGGSWTLLLENR